MCCQRNSRFPSLFFWGVVALAASQGALGHEAEVLADRALTAAMAVVERIAEGADDVTD